MSTPERGKHARRHALVRLWRDFQREYADATYTRIGQRAVQLWLIGAFFLSVNLALTVALITTLS